jgi:tetratricopeptide (TPR) repeat protein
LIPRVRVWLIVGTLAAAAAGLTVGVTVVTSGKEDGALAAPKPRAGSPPLALDLGVRTDPDAQALRRAARLYNAGKRSAARPIFARYDSLQARTGLAFSRWPDDSLRAVEQLSAANPRSAFARLHLGLAYLWAGRGADALAAWRAALRVQPDCASAVHADDLVHPNFAQGLPVFVPTFPVPPGIARLSPPSQLAALAAAARRRGAHAKVLYGIALQRLGKPLSAERQYAGAARLAPADPEAQVAAAVGLFSKAMPSRAFSRLGPLARRFPKAATVRFHLGLLLLWIGSLEPARRQLRLAVRDDPDGPLGREARLFLDRLKGVRKS